eukprot:1315818-Amorphochlora_amoeboformis.AAC.2
MERSRWYARVNGYRDVRRRLDEAKDLVGSPPPPNACQGREESAKFFIFFRWKICAHILLEYTWWNLISPQSHGATAKQAGQQSEPHQEHSHPNYYFRKRLAL